MKITTFNPTIVTGKAEEAIELFEALGFVRRHAPVLDAGDKTITRVRMKDGNGFYVDITQADMLPRDMTVIRMNVDDFDEAYDLLVAHGFNLAPGVEVIDIESAKAAMMVSPSGYAIDLIYHKRNRK